MHTKKILLVIQISLPKLSRNRKFQTQKTLSIIICHLNSEVPPPPTPPPGNSTDILRKNVKQMTSKQ